MIPEGTKEFSDFIRDILNKNKKKVHKYYDKTVDHAKRMGVHVNGDSPDDLLKINRPNEPENVRKYRLDVYKPVTKSLCDKVVNTVARILNPRLYRIEFKDRPARIKEGEGIETYLSEDYPYYISLMHYISEVALPKMFADPNGILVIWPENIEIPETEYFKPIPIFYPSCDVVKFKEDEYYVIHKDKKVIIIDKISRKVYKEDGNEIVLVDEYVHGLGSPPCFRMGGLIKGDEQPYYYLSFISGILPHWDKVVTMTSDLDGSIVNHLYPERWEYQTSCNTCSGSGNITKDIANPVEGGDSKVEIKCSICSGSGMVTNRSPFGALTINHDSLNPDAPIPTPPADYIVKDIEPIRELKLTIKDEEQKGYSSINMEILNKVGENQSGVAKTIDRQDLDSFLMKVSNHIFNYLIPNIIWFTAEWRYKNVLEPKTLIEYLPEIHAPRDFSILSLNELMEEYKQARGAKVSAFYTRTLEEEIVNSKFSNNEEKRKEQLAIIRLNPFPGKSEDDLLTALSQGTIKKTDWIKTNYIELLVKQAMIEKDDFLDMNLIEKNQFLNEIIDRDFGDIVVPTIPVNVTG